MNVLAEEVRYLPLFVDGERKSVKEKAKNRLHRLCTFFVDQRKPNSCRILMDHYLDGFDFHCAFIRSGEETLLVKQKRHFRV